MKHTNDIDAEGRSTSMVLMGVIFSLMPGFAMGQSSEQRELADSIYELSYHERYLELNEDAAAQLPREAGKEIRFIKIEGCMVAARTQAFVAQGPYDRHSYFFEMPVKSIGQPEFTSVGTVFFFEMVTPATKLLQIPHRMETPAAGYEQPIAEMKERVFEVPTVGFILKRDDELVVQKLINQIELYQELYCSMDKAFVD